MIRYEYKVRPAPTKGRKVKGLKTPEARFAHTIEDAINVQGAEGWEYLRTDILPSEERQGLTSSHTVYRTVMVFRRLIEENVPTPLEDVVEPEVAEEESTSDETSLETSEAETAPNDEPSEGDQKEDAAQSLEDHEATKEN